MSSAPRASLLAVGGKRHVRCLLIAALAGCAGRAPACVTPSGFAPDDAPLLVGEPLRYRAGHREGTRCVADPGLAARWSAPTSPAIVLDSDGVAHGVRPGPFEVRARLTSGAFFSRHDTTVAAYGVVLPRGWAPAIEPESATVRVGEMVSFRMRAEAGQGSYSFMPYSLFVRGVAGDTALPTRERERRDILDGVGTFHASRPGRAEVVGRLLGREARATLLVLPARGAAGVP